MNKAKIFVITIISLFCISVIGIVILLYSLSTKINIDFNSINIPVSLVQTSTAQDAKGESTAKYLVVDIVDGDTIKVMEDGVKTTIRLIGIDAPEVKTKDCKYKESTELLSDLILNKEVNLEADSTQTDLDKYGRQLRYIFLNGQNINKEIIQEGLAMEYTYSKAYKYKPDFVSAQNSAKKQELGIWSVDCITN